MKEHVPLPTGNKQFLALYYRFHIWFSAGLSLYISAGPLFGHPVFDYLLAAFWQCSLHYPLCKFTIIFAHYFISFLSGHRAFLSQSQAGPLNLEYCLTSTFGFPQLFCYGHKRIWHVSELTPEISPARTSSLWEWHLLAELPRLITVSEDTIQGIA